MGAHSVRDTVYLMGAHSVGDTVYLMRAHSVRDTVLPHGGSQCEGYCLVGTCDRLLYHCG